MKTTADYNLLTSRQGIRHSQGVFSGFPQLPEPCLNFLTAEAQMHRKYVVEQWFNRWVVFAEYSNGNGVFARKWAGAYSTKHHAEKFAELGNYVQKKATEAFKECAKECAGVK